MFNLDQSIVLWRQKMTDGGITNPAILDELESHLREEVERQVRTGAGAETAFVDAVEKIGPASALKNEFKKSATAKAGEKMMIAFAALFVAFGIFLSTAAVILCYQTLTERMMGSAALVLTLLIACCWPRLVPYLPVIREKRQRRIWEIASLLGGCGLATLYVQTLVPHFAITGITKTTPRAIVRSATLGDPNAKREIKLGAYLIRASNNYGKLLEPRPTPFGFDGLLPAMGLWALLPVALGFGLACGLEQAVRKDTSPIPA